MLAELNDMIERRERGEPYDFDGFMQRYGDLFPGDPETLDELLEQMAARMAAMSRLLASMSPQQRAELQALAEQVMQDMDLAFEVDRLGANLASAFPEMPWGEPALAGGDEQLPLSATVDAMERLHDFEELDRSLRGDYPGASIDDVDEESLRSALGEDAVRDLRRLKRDRAGARAGRPGLAGNAGGSRSRRRARARWGSERWCGCSSISAATARARTRPARPAAWPSRPARPGRGGSATRARSRCSARVFNAVVRGGDAGDTACGSPDDFELVEAEQRTETATALLLDLSFSMPLRGHFVHAKKMALALHALIEGRYPHDTLYLIGFSDYARRMEPTGPRRCRVRSASTARTCTTRSTSRGACSREHPRAARQVIMVTDGEPTAHLEGDQALFSWPPIPQDDPAHARGGDARSRRRA